ERVGRVVPPAPEPQLTPCAAHVVGAQHTPPSSTVPLQLSSSPLQLSAVACAFWLQAMPPPTHADVRTEQTPARPVTHAEPPPGLPSSIDASQSSSLLL